MTDIRETLARAIYCYDGRRPAPWDEDLRSDSHWALELNVALKQADAVLALEWPREIWMAEREDHDQGVVSAVLSEQATVARFAGDVERDRDFHRYVDGDIYDSADRYHETMTADLRAQNMALVDAVARLSEARDELDALLNEGIATDADTYQQAFAEGLEAASHAMPHYFAIYSPTGINMGVWDDGATAEHVKSECGDGYYIVESVDCAAILALKEPQP